jgi:hypothetical protein
MTHHVMCSKTRTAMSLLSSSSHWSGGHTTITQNGKWLKWKIMEGDLLLCRAKKKSRAWSKDSEAGTLFDFQWSQNTGVSSGEHKTVKRGTQGGVELSWEQPELNLRRLRNCSELAFQRMEGGGQKLSTPMGTWGRSLVWGVDSAHGWGLLHPQLQVEARGGREDKNTNNISCKRPGSFPGRAAVIMSQKWREIRWMTWRGDKSCCNHQFAWNVLSKYLKLWNKWQKLIFS